MKSPGIYKESFALQYATDKQHSIRAAFAGSFEKGPVGEAIAITSLDSFIEIFSNPNDDNYNDWYQVANFLKYHKGIYVTRAANLDHDFVNVDSVTKSVIYDRALTVNTLSNFGISHKFKLYDRFTFSGDNEASNNIYTIVDEQTQKFNPPLMQSVFKEETVKLLTGVVNATAELPGKDEIIKVATTKNYANPAVVPFVDGPSFFNEFRTLLSFSNVKSPLTIYARSPGLWGNKLKVAVVLPEDLTTTKHIFPNYLVRNVFAKQPILKEQVGVAVMFEDKVVEVFACYPRDIETVINQKSNYILIQRNLGEIYSTAYDTTDTSISLIGGQNAPCGVDDIARATHIFDDKDRFKFDVLIGNERDHGLSAISCAVTRKDIVAIVGAPFDNFMPNANDSIIDNLVYWRNNVFVAESALGCKCAINPEELKNAVTLESPYVVFVGNYLVVNDPDYKDKTRPINVAGDVAGLRCEANELDGVFTACAGYNRGKIKASGSLVYNPTQQQRDVLYENNINPVVAVSGVGNVLMGQRTLDQVGSAFSKWHVRSLTNFLETNIEHMLRSYLMENINHFTMASVVSSIKPILSRIHDRGGLEWFEVTCDSSNNNTVTINNNELHVDVVFKPTSVAEYIVLRMVNSGNESYSKVTELTRTQQAY